MNIISTKNNFACKLRSRVLCYQPTQLGFLLPPTYEHVITSRLWWVCSKLHKLIIFMYTPPNSKSWLKWYLLLEDLSNIATTYIPTATSRDCSHSQDASSILWHLYFLYSTQELQHKFRNVDCSQPISNTLILTGKTSSFIQVYQTGEGDT